MAVITATPTTDFLGTCTPCRRPVRVTDEHRHQRFKTVTVACAECARPVRAQRIYATVSDHTCDASCLFATRSRCMCSCRGKNHGIRFAPTSTGRALASALGLYRERHAHTEAQRQRRAETKRAAAARAAQAWREANTALVAWLAANHSRPFCADMTRLIERGEQMTASQERYARDLMDRDQNQRADARQWRVDNPDVVAFLRSQVGNDFFTKMSELVEHDHQLSERQEAAVRRGMADARKAESISALAPVRATVAGDVIALSQERQEYGYSMEQTVDKMTIRTDTGQEVTVTVPQAAYTALGVTAAQPLERLLPGRRVSVACTIRPSRNRPWSGWGSRPAKFRLL